MLSVAYTQQKISIKGCLYFTFIRNVWRPSDDKHLKPGGWRCFEAPGGTVLVYQIVLITVRHMIPPTPWILIFLLRDTNVSRRKNDKMNMNGPGQVGCREEGKWNWRLWRRKNINAVLALVIGTLMGWALSYCLYCLYLSTITSVFYPDWCWSGDNYHTCEVWNVISVCIFDF